MLFEIPSLLCQISWKWFLLVCFCCRQRTIWNAKSGPGPRDQSWLGCTFWKVWQVLNMKASTINFIVTTCLTAFCFASDLQSCLPLGNRQKITPVAWFLEKDSSLLTRRLCSEKSVVWIQIVQFCITEQQWNRMTMDCSSAKERHCKMPKRDWGRFDLIYNKPQLQRGSAMLLLSTKLGAQPGGTDEQELGDINLRTVNLSKGLL